MSNHVPNLTEFELTEIESIFKQDEEWRQYVLWKKLEEWLEELEMQIDIPGPPPRGPLWQHLGLLMQQKKQIDEDRARRYGPPETAMRVHVDPYIVLKAAKEVCTNNLEFLDSVEQRVRSAEKQPV